MIELTPRELQVVEAIRSGARTYAHIARALDPAVSKHTAEAHVRRVSSKLRELEDYAQGAPLFVVTLYALRTDAESGGP